MLEAIDVWNIQAFVTRGRGQQIWVKKTSTYKRETRKLGNCLYEHDPRECFWEQLQLLQKPFQNLSNKVMGLANRSVKWFSITGLVVCLPPLNLKWLGLWGTAIPYRGAPSGRSSRGEVVQGLFWWIHFDTILIEILPVCQGMFKPVFLGGIVFNMTLRQSKTGWKSPFSN